MLFFTFIWKLCYKLPSIVTFTVIQIFDQILSSLLNGVKVATFSWYSDRVHIILGVQFERRKNIDKKANLNEK